MIPGFGKNTADVLKMVRKTIYKKYYASYKKKIGMTDTDVAPWHLPFLIFRLSMWNIDSEL
ncbi:MAG: hypothetical protein VB064_03460 [Oscillospiraceae bacterium]|nr:hypothetical protein [Oscillospiraceae bacterium]